MLTVFFKNGFLVAIMFCFFQMGISQSVKAQDDAISVSYFRINVKNVSENLLATLKDSDKVLHYAVEENALIIFTEKEFPKSAFEALIESGYAGKYEISGQGEHRTRTRFFKKE